MLYASLSRHTCSSFEQSDILAERGVNDERWIYLAYGIHPHNANTYNEEVETTKRAYSSQSIRRFFYSIQLGGVLTVAHIRT